MACETPSDLTRISKEVKDLWTTNKSIERYGLTDDISVFKRMFDTVTGKPFMEGSPINSKDMAKMKVAIQDLIYDLKSPGILENKMLRHIYVGSAKGMRNPVTKQFYDTLVRANEFRNRNTQNMLASFKDMMSNLKLSLIEADGIDTSEFVSTENITRGVGQRLAEVNANKKIKNLKDHELSLIKAIREGRDVGTTSELAALDEFFENEGFVFQDLVDRIEAGNDKALRLKYQTSPNRNRYVNLINNAANDWKNIQLQAKDHLVQSINNLNETIQLKYGKYSRTAKFLAGEYKEIAKQLEDKKDPYLPHFVLDIIGQSMEIRDKISEASNDIEVDNILKEYTDKTKDININLSNRLKKESVDRNKGYWSKNPFLFAGKYIEQVTQFNHSTYVDNAYIKGLHDLTKVIFKNPETKEAAAAKQYKEILTEQYNAATGKDTPTEVNNLVRFLTSMQFVSKLGWSPRSAIRNQTQRLLNWAYYGETMQIEAMQAYKDADYLNAMNNELNYHGLQFVDVSKVTEGAITGADLILDGIDFESGEVTYKEKESLINKLADKGAKIADASSVFTKYVENANRKSTFKLAFHKRVEALKKTDKYSNWAENADLKEKMYREAGNVAANMTSMIHFEYSKFGKASALTTKTGSFLFQFQHYRMSFANLQAQMIKDYKRAFKAGDYSGEEMGRLVRMGLIHSLSEILSIGLGVNLTTYIANDTLEYAMNFKDLLLGDEEDKEKAFFGKGLVGAVGSVPLSDAVELYNLGAAAGYWNLMSDEDEYLGFLTGMRRYDDIDNTEFAKETAGMFNLELHRLRTRVIPTWRNYGFWTALGQELALYPGETTIGLNTRNLHKKYIAEKEPKYINYKGISNKRPDKREQALKALSLLRSN